MKSYIWIQAVPRSEQTPAGAIVEGFYTVVAGEIRVTSGDRTIATRKLEPGEHAATIARRLLRDWALNEPHTGPIPFPKKGFA